ncbi:hypothetical protein BDV27DRAFT_128523 [Aspergillus caelatus]|uniref:Uncharacterized protein n=1 Tax=Aspergillus caelatus TaxID=61420 RepID=A0A5N7A3T3_9EURO|nr:uncharacterized protein BDV27DRAFT_128523 [Aspergillus caelatus]KAE8364355.1 hypothetical protein BDV27DRAFT_128523 [Aspergillus caelatus]
MMLSSRLSEVSGMISALSVTNAVPGLGRTVDILSEKASPKEQQKAASLEAQSSYLYAKDARVYDLRRRLSFDGDARETPRRHVYLSFKRSFIDLHTVLVTVRSILVLEVKSCLFGFLFLFLFFSFLWVYYACYTLCQLLHMQQAGIRIM